MKGRKGWEAGRKQKAEGASRHLLKGASGMSSPEPPSSSQDQIKTILRKMPGPGPA